MAEVNKEAAKGVKARSEVKDKQVKEYYERDAKNVPTPTQAENDLAKVGVHVEHEQAKGTETDEEYQRRAMEGRLPGSNPYDTREARGIGQPERRREESAPTRRDK